MKARWTCLTTSPSLQRSSHCLSVIDKKIYVYGGELRPREPVDNDIHVVDIPVSNSTSAVLSNAASPQTLSHPTAPQSRVGSASIALNGKIYFFSGRGGVEMKPIEEHGALWVFDANNQKTDTAESLWTKLEPAGGCSTPEGRSYHAMTSDGKDTIYVHAGCPEKGRLSDLWAFDVNECKWTQLADAPEPARGGPSIAYLHGRLYRMHGFDGKNEQGGAIDVYDLKKDSWETIDFQPDGIKGPGKRSVACLALIERNEHASLVTMFGESDPSNLGHQGAGKMLGDAWMYDLEGKRWERIEWEGNGPAARGWFDADVWTVRGTTGVAIGGGLAESNERLDDVWVMEFLDEE